MKFKMNLVYFFISLMKLGFGFRFLLEKVDHASNRTLISFPIKNTTRYSVVLKPLTKPNYLNSNVLFDVRDGKSVVYSFYNETKFAKRNYFLRLSITDNLLAVTIKIKLRICFVTHLKKANYLEKFKKSVITFIKMKQSNTTLSDLFYDICLNRNVLVFPENICKCLDVSNVNKVSLYEHQISVRGCFLNKVLFLKPEHVKLILKPKRGIKYFNKNIKDNKRENFTRHKRSTEKYIYGKHKRSQVQYLMFKQLVYKTSVSENKPSKTFVFRIQVDYQLGKSSLNVRYTMTALKNRKSNDMFSLNPSTGVITTLVPLDREVMDSHTFNILATSNDQSIGQASSKLVINVLDVNDNQPIFSQYPYVESIKENIPIGSYVLKVHADDPDENENGNIKFSFLKVQPQSNVFSINEFGEIFTKGTLDREKFSKYFLTVCAKDGGNPTQSSTVNVTINIEDQNDNTPQFTQKEYIVNVRESVQKNFIIAKVVATDLDKGKNGLVEYKITSGDHKNKFDINKTTGEIEVKSPFDFETEYRGFELRIMAYDQGQPPKFNTSGKVIVRILDVNDNAPRFVGLPYNVTLAENFKLQTKFLTIQAVDDDFGENSKIKYTIPNVSLHFPFKIQSTSSGEVILVKKLDYEKVKSYKFKVRASDSDPRHSRYSETFVYVNVKDINDNPPVFEKQVYEKRIKEDSYIGEEVILIKAIDQDLQASRNIDYKIVEGNTNEEFNILSNNNVGTIRLEKLLDYSRQNSYTLKVRASDGGLYGFATIKISVSDTNSYPPTFVKGSFTVEVKENITKGSEITRVQATDNDNGENARISYCFVNSKCKVEDNYCCPNIQNEFQLDTSTGTITTKGALDYESSTLITLIIKAHDHGDPILYDLTSIDIYLQDVNDNVPQFDHRVWRGSIYENVKRSKVILRVHADDADSQLNSQIIYKLQNDVERTFDIDKRSGSIRAIKPLDRENIDEYKLTVLAVDSGTPRLTASAAVIVDVLDVDDNPPIFQDDDLYYSIREDAEINTSIALITAIDPDTTQSSKISYEIGHDPYALSKFGLNRRTGELVLKDTLDYETRKNYTFTVSAISGELINQVLVHVMVQDCNDNFPVFENFEIHFNNYRAGNVKSFYSDIIGKVPAFDPDESDVLTYKFLSGNDANLLIMNESTGDLKLNSTLDSDRLFVAEIKILVTDGKHDVSAKCTLRVTGVTDEMLSHSITVRVLNSNDYKFLSPKQLSNFTAGLANIFETEKNKIFVFNVQNDTDVEDKEILNVSFSALQPSSPDIFFTSKYLQHQVYLNRTKLASMTSMNVLPFDDNICLREPCQNYKRCASILTFNSSASFISSSNIIFRPIYPVYSLKCECPIGFTNEAECTDEINMCHSNPCFNQATCNPIEGGYYCICPPNFTGKQCEVDVSRSSCSSHPGICKGGKCADLTGGGFECLCNMAKLKDELTSSCELRSRQFKAGDFLMLPGISNQWHFDLFVSFSTLQPNGLILYNGRLNHKNDFLALELIDGQIRLSFSTGQHTSVVDPTLEFQLNDGQWHTVHIKYYNQRNQGELQYGLLSHNGPSNKKVVVLTVDPHKCDVRISQQLNLNCTKTVEQSDIKTSLDLTSPLILGGVPNLPEQFQVRSKSFIGCLRDLIIDGQRSDLSSYIANQGSIEGCSSMNDHCNKKCSNGGICVNKFDGFECECKDGTSGENCERRGVVKRLLGYGYFKYNSVSTLPMLVLPFQLKSSFKTFQDDGTIMFFQATTLNNIYVHAEIKLSQGKLWYEIYDGRKIFNIKSNKIVLNNGQWHTVHFDWLKNDDLITVIMDIDYGKEIVSKVFSSENWLNKIVVKTISVGGKNSRKKFKTIDGCFQNVILKVDITHIFKLLDNVVSTKGAKYSSKCSSHDTCALHNTCSVGSYCVSTWANYFCKCKKGYVGSNCTSVCDFNPCYENSVCKLDKDKVYGYRCECKAGYTGENCQFKLSGRCPPGWYGQDGMCAPCKCSTSNHYDLICHSLTGACHCKKNFYYKSATNSCHPCDCYSPGSLRRSCSNELGKCVCKKNVYGNKCDNCSYAFAEIGENGCKVLDGVNMCPKNRRQGIVWSRTRIGQADYSSCPEDTVGKAIRECRKNGWLEPTFTNCTNKKYSSFESFTTSYEKKNIYLSQEFLANLAMKIRVITETTQKFYANDVEISSNLISLLLKHESLQSGFGLAMARETSFTGDLVRATSAIISNKTQSFWKMENPSMGLSAPYLIKNWQKYISTLVENAEKVHLDRAKYISSENILFSLDTLVKNDDKMLSVPKDMLLSGIYMTLPNTLFIKNKTKKTKKRSVHSDELFLNSIVVGLMSFKKLKDIFPLSFEVSQSVRIPKRPTVNSELLSFVVKYRGKSLKYMSEEDRNLVSKIYDEKGFMREIPRNKDPIQISLKLITPENIVDPLCVMWNFSDSVRTSLKSVGGWSQDGCIYSHSNKTHVICNCYMNGTVAVITEKEITSVLKKSSVSAPVTIVVSLSIAMLLVVVLAQICLSAVRSVRSIVNRNLVVAYSFANILFLVGIQRTADLYWCMASAVLIHFFVLSNFAWIVVDVLHIYRTIIERRNVNHGHSRVYYLIGWIIPSVITALSLGLDAKGFGNSEFCWISVQDYLIWSFVGL